MKTKNKSEIIAIISRLDLLDFIHHAIDKKQPATTKQNQLKKFADASKAYIDDERDVLLIAIKLK